MKEEIKIAAKWWADQLRIRAKQDNGDAMQSSLMKALTQSRSPIEEEKIQKFEAAFAEILEKNYRDNWNPEKPEFGSYYRCIGVDYGPDERLRDAVKIAGIDWEYRFPVKTNMWVDPGEVKVSRGYRGPIEVLYSSKTPNSPDKT